jgi:hypothetical protein
VDYFYILDDLDRCTLRLESAKENSDELSTGEPEIEDAIDELEIALAHLRKAARNIRHRAAK